MKYACGQIFFFLSFRSRKKSWMVSFFSPSVQVHGGLICTTSCLSVCNKNSDEKKTHISESMKISTLSPNQGWKLLENSVFPSEKYRKYLPVLHYFCLSQTLPDMWTSENRLNFSLSFGKVPKNFTCPPLFLPVPDRRTVSNFHPCTKFYWFNKYVKGTTYTYCLRNGRWAHINVK